MLNATLVQLIKKAAGIIAGGVFALLSFLPGEAHSTPGTELPKTLIEFIETCPNVPDEHQAVFIQARDAQIGSQLTVAQDLYGQLLQHYPNNSVIIYNLNLVNKPNE